MSTPTRSSAVPDSFSGRAVLDAHARHFSDRGRHPDRLFFRFRAVSQWYVLDARDLPDRAGGEVSTPTRSIALPDSFRAAPAPRCPCPTFCGRGARVHHFFRTVTSELLAHLVDPHGGGTRAAFQSNPRPCAHFTTTFLCAASPLCCPARHFQVAAHVLIDFFDESPRSRTPTWSGHLLGRFGKHFRANRDRAAISMGHIIQQCPEMRPPSRKGGTCRTIWTRVDPK